MCDDTGGGTSVRLEGTRSTLCLLLDVPDADRSRSSSMDNRADRSTKHNLAFDDITANRSETMQKD